MSSFPAVQERMLALLEDQLGQAERAQPKLMVSEVTNLARAVANLTAEMRKSELARREMFDKLPPAERDELVSVYIQTLPRDRRRVLIQLLGALDQKESLLG